MNIFFLQEAKKVKSIGNIFEMRYEQLLSQATSNAKDLPSTVISILKELSYIHAVSQGIANDFSDHCHKYKLAGKDFETLMSRMKSWSSIIESYIEFLKANFNPRDVKEGYKVSEMMTSVNGLAEKFKYLNIEIMQEFEGLGNVKD